MSILTERQRQIAEHLLATGDRRLTAQRLGITRITLGQHLAEMRRRLDAPDDAAMMAALRAANRHPVEQMLAVCREQPRTWFTL